jgi:predicted signal transduction protein with EAL and GGDEF domain
MVAEYSRHVAKGLESMADSLGRRNLDDLVGSVEDFARSRPVAFLGGAVVAGFALARFMKSSSARRYDRAAPSRTAGSAAGMSGSSMPGAGTYDAAAEGRSERGGL